MSPASTAPSRPRVIALADRRPARDGGTNPAASTEALVTRARHGDLDAWSQLYQDHFDALFRHVCYLTGDPALAEDLVQEAFARAMTSAASYDGRSSFVGWLRGIALNVVRMHWRRSRTKERVHHDLHRMQGLAPEDGRPDQVHQQEHRMRVVYEILDGLPSHLREAFVLRELQGLPTHEAAQQLGISANNLAVRATRARQRIREELARRGWSSMGGAP